MKKFKELTEKEKLDGLGFKSKHEIPVELMPFPSFFPNIEKPISEDDWLTQYKESPQTFKIWKKENKQDVKNKVAYLQPLGKLKENSYPPIPKLKEFVEKYYPGIIVKLLLPLELQETEKGELFVSYKKSTSQKTFRKKLQTRRSHPYDQHKVPSNARQIGVDILLKILAESSPPDSICLISFTMEDLFQKKSDSFVVGMADGSCGVGVFSFARYDPHFHTYKKNSPEQQHILFQRSCKVLVHEIGHLLGLDHCVFYSCCMNGSGHLEEDFSQPLHLCPIDLKKVQDTFGCNLLKRYEDLAQFYKENSFIEEYIWTKNLLEKIISHKKKEENNDSLSSSNEKKKKFKENSFSEDEERKTKKPKIEHSEECAHKCKSKNSCKHECCKRHIFS